MGLYSILVSALYEQKDSATQHPNPVEGFVSAPSLRGWRNRNSQSYHYTVMWPKTESGDVLADLLCHDVFCLLIRLIIFNSTALYLPSFALLSLRMERATLCSPLNRMIRAASKDPTVVSSVRGKKKKLFGVRLKLAGLISALTALKVHLDFVQEKMNSGFFCLFVFQINGRK